MYRISLSTARTVYPTLLLGSVILCNTIPFFVIALALSMAAIILSLTISLLYPTQLSSSCTSRASSRREEEEGSGGTLLGQQRIEGGTMAAAIRPRLHYIDNLKSVLTDRKSTRLNSSHADSSRMPSSA